MLLEDLLNLILKINDDTEHCMFFRYYGHIDLVEVDFHEGGWDKTHDYTMQFEFKAYEHEKIKEVYNKLEKYLL